MKTETDIETNETMKVYFEESGEYTDNNDRTFIEYQMFVKPNSHYEAYVYDIFGRLSMFSWADKDESRCFDHRELPGDLWYSFTHGVDTVMVPAEANDNWQLSDLIYDKLTKEKVAEYQKNWKEFLENEEYLLNLKKQLKNDRRRKNKSRGGKIKGTDG